MHNHNNQSSIPSMPTLSIASPFLTDLSEQLRTGAAQRRKQRRLRSWWRHEQQSIVAALTTSLHHSSQGQRKARAGAEESELHCTARVWKTPPPQPELVSLYEEEPCGGPACQPGRATGAAGARGVACRRRFHGALSCCS